MAADEIGLSSRVRGIEPSGIRRIFELMATMEDPINLSIGQAHYDPPTELELQRAKNQVEAARVFEQDSNFRHAMLLGQAETVGAGWQKVQQFLERIRAVTTKDVQRVARQYLIEDARTVGTLIPLPPKRPDTAPATAKPRKS